MSFEIHIITFTFLLAQTFEWNFWLQKATVDLHFAPEFAAWDQRKWNSCEFLDGEVFLPWVTFTSEGGRMAFS